MTDPLTSNQTSIGRAGPGTVVGDRYTLRAAVGHGGMGTVWRATDTQLNRDVAVKEVAPPPGIAPEDRDAMYERMLREARAAALLSHPGVVQVYDVVTEGDRPWIVMELLDARSLSDMVLEDGPLAPRAAAKIGVTLLGALEVAHAAGVLHRDVKPANVLVCADGRCVLTDFGVARMPTDQQLTTPGMVLGSPHFISPERALGASFGPPSDLFSLGVTLYCAVEGRPPFDKGEPIATMHSVVEDEPLPPQRAGVLTEVLYGLLDKNPDRRWDAPTARVALRELLAGPLASRTPQFPTDPYAVVPSQRLPWQGGGPSSQIGGRALLAPDEVPTGRAGPQGATYGPQGATYGAQGAMYGPTAAPDQIPDAYGQLPDAYGTDTTFAGTGTGTGQPRHASAHSAGGQGFASALTETGGRLLVAARQAPRRAAVAATAAAAAVLLVLTSILLVARDDDSGGAPSAQDPPAASAAPPDGPPFAVQTVTDRGVQVNLPENWQEAERTDIRVDYVAPDLGENARIRLLAEPSGRDSRRFVEGIAESTIQQNCDPLPYERVALADFEMDGHQATQLEYTCGTGGEALHTLWVTTVRDGTAYSFFLRLPEGEFDEHRGIFDEMVRSFQVVDA